MALATGLPLRVTVPLTLTTRGPELQPSTKPANNSPSPQRRPAPRSFFISPPPAAVRPADTRRNRNSHWWSVAAEVWGRHSCLPWELRQAGMPTPHFSRNGPPVAVSVSTCVGGPNGRGRGGDEERSGGRPPLGAGAVVRGLGAGLQFRAARRQGERHGDAQRQAGGQRHDSFLAGQRPTQLGRHRRAGPVHPGI